ncbi:MAG TPA: ornithine--oxo-acid transaminase [Vicinamibacterales bacterium]
MRTNDYIALEDSLGAHNYHPLDVVVDRAVGCWVWDVEGKKYLDCLAAYSAVNQGHCHPTILQAMVEQARRVTLTSRAFRNDQLPLLYKDLHELTGFDVALPMNSGAEAVETALKAARKWGYTVKGIPDGQAEIIACRNNFHGRTISIISFSTEEQYRSGFGPLTPGFRVIPYGDADALRKAITANTCAFLVEPIQGEAGIIMPPDGFLKAAAAICRENRVLFIADEIQSGLGRTGKLFAYQHEGVTPDAVIVGKALSGGFYPISAVLASKAVLGVFNPGDHGSTFGGNPLAAAIARASLRVIVEERLVERSAELGAYFLDELKRRQLPGVREVRGRGLWIGVEMDGPARPHCEALMREGMLCKETHERVIRIAPPLVITRDEIDWAVGRLEAVLGRTAPVAAK